MKPEQMTEALEQAATQLGVQVRYDTMTGDAAGSGGLCKVKGESVGAYLDPEGKVSCYTGCTEQ